MGGGTFLVLDKGKELPATDVSALLGRFVTDPAEPSFQFTPQHTNPTVLLGEGAATLMRNEGNQNDGTEIHSRFTSSVRRVLSLDRKSTRLNSSHLVISYAVFCLKK